MKIEESGMSEEKLLVKRGHRVETWVQTSNLDAMQFKIAELELQIEDAEVQQTFLSKVQIMAQVEIDRIRSAKESKTVYHGPQ